MGVLNVDQVGEQLFPTCSCHHRAGGPNRIPHCHPMGVLNVDQIEEQLPPQCNCPHTFRRLLPCSAPSPYRSTECQPSQETVAPTVRVVEKQSASSPFGSIQSRSSGAAVPILQENSELPGQGPHPDRDVDCRRYSHSAGTITTGTISTATETSRDIRTSSEDNPLAESEQKDPREAPPGDTPRRTLTYKHALLIALLTLTQEYFCFTLTLTHRVSELHSHTFPVPSI